MYEISKLYDNDNWGNRYEENQKGMNYKNDSSHLICKVKVVQNSPVHPFAGTLGLLQGPLGDMQIIRNIWRQNYSVTSSWCMNQIKTEVCFEVNSPEEEWMLKLIMKSVLQWWTWIFTLGRNGWPVLFTVCVTEFVQVVFSNHFLQTRVKSILCVPDFFFPVWDDLIAALL